LSAPNTGKAGEGWSATTNKLEFFVLKWWEKETHCHLLSTYYVQFYVRFFLLHMGF
jgi:hypothetical protein